MAMPLDQQFKIQKKGIMEERIPALVNIHARRIETRLDDGRSI